MGDNNLPHVTAILGGIGLYDFQWASEEAKERGQRVHKALHFLAQGDLDWKTVDEADEGFVRAGQRFLRETGFKVELVEHPVTNRLYGYQGTLDLYGKTPTGRDTLVDWKSSESGVVIPEVALQLAAYGFALQPGRIFDRVAVGLKPDGKYQVKWFPTETYQEDGYDFLACLRVQRRLARK